MLENKISSSTKNNVLNAIETRIIKPMDKHFAGDPDILRRHVTIFCRTSIWWYSHIIIKL